MCVSVCMIILLVGVVSKIKYAYIYFRFFVMYLINKDETEHTGQVNRNNSLYPCFATYILNTLVGFKESTYWTLKQQVKPIFHGEISGG